MKVSRGIVLPVVLFLGGGISPSVFGQTLHEGNAIAGRIGPGDTVVVSKEDAALKIEEKTVARLRKGARITVTQVQDAWVGGTTTVDGKALRGWVRMGDVVPAIVIDNASPRVCTYQVRLSGNEKWGQPLALVPGEHHTYTPDGRLVIRVQEGKAWTTWVFDPGKCVRYQQAPDGNGELVDDRGDAPGRLKTRQIPVLAVADETYRRIHPDWKDRIAEIVATASTCFEDAFSLRLKLVDCEAWQYKAARHGKAQVTMNSLIAIERPAFDGLVIGWIGIAQAGPTADSYTYASSNAFGRHILIADAFSVMRTTRTLVHCLGRTFGAFGVVNRESVMHRELGTTYPIEFGDVARQAILLGRDVDFRTGVKSLKPEDARKIRELYRKHHHPSDPPDDDPIKNGLRTLELYRSLEKARVLT